MALRHTLGKESEDLALQWFLDQKCCRLIARNYRSRGGELDLIFEETLESRQIELVFVEVRARAAEAMVDGLHSVGWKKQRRLKHTIAHFLMNYQGQARTLRIDLLYRDGIIWNYLPNLWIV